MTTTTQASPLRAFILEPVSFAVSQPGQILISSASVAIVAAEAGTLIPFPFNLALAIGAEWVYLRGLISGSGVKTRWAAALNWSAVLLVVCYGALWGFRGFHLIPEAPPAWAAVLLTIIHIGCIGAVTICSAMLHRAGEDVKAFAARQVADVEAERNRRNLEAEAERNRRAHDAAAELAIEMRRQDAELRLETERNRLRTQAAAERAQLRSATKAAVAAQPGRAPVIVDGVEYPSIQAAADAHGITRQAMSKRLKK